MAVVINPIGFEQSIASSSLREKRSAIQFTGSKTAKKMTIVPYPAGKPFHAFMLPQQRKRKIRNPKEGATQQKKKKKKKKKGSEWSPPSPEMFNAAHGYLAGVCLLAVLLQPPISRSIQCRAPQSIRNRTLHTPNGPLQYSRRSREACRPVSMLPHSIVQSSPVQYFFVDNYFPPAAPQL